MHGVEITIEKLYSFWAAICQVNIWRCSVITID